MFVVKFRKLFYTLSSLLVAASLFSIFFYGLNFGIDFKGGSIVEMEYKSAPDIEVLKSSVQALNLGEFSVRKTGEKGAIVRLKDLTTSERTSVMSVLTKNDGILKRFDSVGPILGSELARKAVLSLVFVILGIVLFITFAFRGVSKPVASWKYGLIAIVALIHDVIVPTGVFAYLGHFANVQIDSLFVTALLVILGFSIHDTIVVFDRTRENLKRNEEYREKKEFETIVGESVSQTFARSINTSLTTLISLVVLYVIGPEATKNFSLALLVGIVAGTYSSIFLASPLLVTVEKWQSKQK